MKLFVTLLFLFLLFSCDRINSFTASFLKEKETVDLTSVDRYPLFKNCDPLLNFKEGKYCFEKSFNEKVNQQIQNLKLKSTLHHTDTLLIKFRIDTIGRFKCLQIKIDSVSKASFPGLETEIKKIISNLEQVTPAQKRNIPVTTQYTFPVIMQTK